MPNKNANERRAYMKVYSARPEQRAKRTEYSRTRKGRRVQKLAKRASNAKHPERKNARSRVAYAVKTGKLIKQPCAVCGSLTVQAHHADYNKPLDVQWLCVKDHRIADKASDL